MPLEFFCTEPLETLINKRAAFIAAHQWRDPSLWYDGLLAEWAMDTHVMLGPDNYDRIEGWRIYAVTCDDPGLGKPAFLAAKNAEYPVQAEVEALDYYIENFVWGGLQRTTEETFAYGIYSIPDWKTNRENDDPGTGRQAAPVADLRLPPHHADVPEPLPGGEALIPRSGPSWRPATTSGGPTARPWPCSRFRGRSSAGRPTRRGS